MSSSWLHSTCLAIAVLGTCAPRRSPPPPPPPDDRIQVSIPHPGYLDDCAPTLALRPGEQRRFDFQCAGPGIFNETESSWGPPDAWDDVRIKIADPNVRTCGLCGCIFSLTFTTSTAYGELVAGPGPRCGASRWYWGRIQRPRNPAYPEAWSIMLGDGLPPMKMIATYK